MTVLVLGAGGIVGQEMIHCAPGDDGYTSDGDLYVFTSRSGDGPYTAFDADVDRVSDFLDRYRPHVVVNLMGENRVDVVEENPASSEHINVRVPLLVAKWCARNRARLIHVSTQGVFSGENAPYSPYDIPHPITSYGKQKRRAEVEVFEELTHTGLLTIARLTFVIGVRRFFQGRKNPLESMFEDSDQIQVDDRFFSPVWSRDAAKILWDLVYSDRRGIVHIGEPVKCSRYMLACEAAWGTNRNIAIKPASHKFFKGIAPRPMDTTWSKHAMYFTHYQTAILESYIQWIRQKKESDVES